MFSYPPQAAVNRAIPKNKIYSHSKASRSLQSRFVAEVDKITWLYKLAPESINIPATKNLQEIQVFEIRLKQQELHEDILRAIDRTIRHPISFQLKLEDQIRYAMALKRHSGSDTSKWVVGEYFFTDWEEDSSLNKSLPLVLNMEALYEQLLRAHMPLPPRKGEPLADHVERIGLLQQKRREADKLEARIHKTKQFNRKVELNQKFKALESEIETLYN